LIELPKEVADLFHGANIAHIATLMKDGSPQVTANWIEIVDDRIQFNTDEGRVKPKNLRRDARVAISITDKVDASNWAMVRGRAVDFVTEGALVQRDRLTKKYMDLDAYPFAIEGERRVVVVIEPESFATHLL
jgi:PPOX class probable F420-dependent enzyme